MSPCVPLFIKELVHLFQFSDGTNKLVPWSLKIKLGLPRLAVNRLRAAIYESSLVGDWFRVDNLDREGNKQTDKRLYDHWFPYVNILDLDSTREVNSNLVKYWTWCESFSWKLSNHLRRWFDVEFTAGDTSSCDRSD